LLLRRPLRAVNGTLRALGTRWTLPARSTVLARRARWPLRPFRARLLLLGLLLLWRAGETFAALASAAAATPVASACSALALRLL
jgi:hypothetical protein